MSATLSEATGRPYGIQRVCQAWERSRSALYARQTREQQRHTRAAAAQGRGARAAGSDAHGVGRDAAGGDSGRSRPLAVPGRGPSEGPRAAADLGRDQIRYWGIRPSYGFVEEPETNGVAERWNRTLKEQATHGRIFQNLKEVRDAVTAFVERYNTTWRLEKLGYHTPIEAREAHELRRAA